MPKYTNGNNNGRQIYKRPQKLNKMLKSNGFEINFFTYSILNYVENYKCKALFNKIYNTK